MDIHYVGIGLLSIVLTLVLIKSSFKKLFNNLFLAIILLICLFVLIEIFAGNGIEAAKMSAPSKSSSAFMLAHSYLLACVVSLIYKSIKMVTETKSNSETDGHT
ncbi:MAG: hypothetical protein KUF82_21045 [Candidatus Thiodiazotropha sp. (ex Ctena orbiculata)]|uniref:Uncharacterized protein n=1 Tax=Candidatus Thiodiazotropha taylori TaxID=2792791 RepID=A0A944MC12_9GAMM|nr:hypothetical protein [Candidatus Thiodiazotropha taylori]MBV2113448.1 hypothetical protein [Candidatus Thiodiazotropha taylori]MBV2136182.1 hypothetical protein [Candidatus Thiodiazotropha taylori]